MIRTFAAVSLLAFAAASAQAQVPAGNSAPKAAPMVDTIPQPRDIPYPGTITLDIDATNVEQGIFVAHESVPVAGGGDVVMLFPKWLPGNHSPSGQIEKLAGLHFRSGGRELSWTRDPVDVFAFHVAVPDGAKRVDIDLQFLSATKGDQGSVVTSPDMLRLQWNSMSLYPAGYYTRQIPVAATVKYPAGFTAVSAVPSRSTTNATGASYSYQLTNYEVLVDSPVLAGRYYKAFPLTPRVTLDTFADTPDQLAAKPDQIAAHARLVDQAVKTFGAQHYDNYHFLFSISDQLGGIGLEHHRSSEDGSRPGYFTEWDNQINARNLLPHEFTHSWDGKFRRGADLWTPDFRQPMGDSLLWVYEGQTQFWGYVLQARAGLVSKQDTLDQYAAMMALYDSQKARSWRPLIDTTNDPTISQRRPKGWVSFQRSEDYYVEGLFVWMEVDAMLREKSGGAKSIDDFARAFFGVRDGDYGELTYTFDDVASTLNGIVPYDWAGFLQRRLTEKAAGAPLDGFVRDGYRLVFTDTPSKIFMQGEKARKGNDFSYSVGFVASATGDLTSVLWDGPAFKAGLTVGDTIVTVGDMAYSDDRLKAAITAAKTGRDPITLTIKSGDRFRNVTIDYHNGLRYPHLEKIGTGEGGLDKLLAPRP